ncbi:unnamed protein product [Adineta steineri]|uniref:ADP ribosyltransferase domain-containing protein n=2 Tax=Adineta steineri TaxID=433720 RepID=A0A819CDA1_9BILA|nr:unnamed protein product [Adineta steineri]
MLVRRSYDYRKNYVEIRFRHSLSSEQENFEKNRSKQSTSSYYTIGKVIETKQHINSKSNLSIQFQLFQPNVYNYKQLLQTVFSTIHESALAKSAMIDFCLQLYANNNTLTDIRNFIENYRPEDAILWYTKESFVYRWINHTLRCGDIDKCYSLRLFISNLSTQIRVLKYEQPKMMKRTVLYRGFRQSDEELNILQNLVGHVIAIKSFMSTSREKSIALAFASPSEGQNENSRSILLEINVDLNLSEIIAADIMHMSNFSGESEVLFNIGSKFRIDKLTLDTTNDIWLCKFTATTENLTCMEQFQIIPYRMSSNSSANNLDDRQKLSWLAYKPIDWAYIQHIDCFVQWQQTDITKILNNSERVLQIYRQIDVKNSFDKLQVASCMNNYAFINLVCGTQVEVVKLLENSLNIREKYLPADDILLAQSYRNLGLSYSRLCNYDMAFKLHERALSINHHASFSAQWSTVTTLRNIGDLCDRIRNYNDAIKYYSEAIDTHYQCLTFLIH